MADMIKCEETSEELAREPCVDTPYGPERWVCCKNESACYRPFTWRREGFLSSILLVLKLLWLMEEGRALAILEEFNMVADRKKKKKLNELGRGDEKVKDLLN